MVDPNRLRDELREMRKLIEKDPETKARFDLDGNGHIDGDEWEQVRALVTKRLEREQEELEEANRLAPEGGAEGMLAAVGGGAIAQQIYEQDLMAANPNAIHGRSITECSELVLEQQGGLGQVFEGMMRRNYAILSADGGTLGTVEQVESEILQDFKQRSIFDAKQLSFKLFDGTTGECLTLDRSEGMMSQKLFIYDGERRQIGYVTWKPGLLGSEYQIFSTFVSGALIVKSKIFKPFSLEIQGVVGNTVGSIQRGWSGLGAFLTGGNRMRIHLDEPGQVDATHRWGLIAAALLADLNAEDSD